MALRFELSPDKECTRGFTGRDWLEFVDRYIGIFDSLSFKDAAGKVYSPRTNVAGSKYMAYLHRDSKSGIPHVHVVACRVDEDGNINNDHNLANRAQQAAERLDRLDSVRQLL